MRKASKVMYAIAIILNCLNFLAVVGLFAGAFFMKRYPSQVAKIAAEYGINELNTVTKVLNMVTPVIIAGFLALAFSIVLLIFGLRALRALEKNETNSTPHIVVIVISALCGDLFYLLASIFGTVNASQVNRQPAQPAAPEENNKQE